MNLSISQQSSSSSGAPSEFLKSPQSIAFSFSMGCCSTRLVGATVVVPGDGSTDASALEFKKLIQRNPRLLAITEKFHTFIFPGIKKNLDDLIRCLDAAHFRVEPIYSALISFKKAKKKKKNKAFVETVSKLHDFNLAAGDPFAGMNTQELQSTLEQLRILMEELRQIKKGAKERLLSTKRRRKAWNAAFTAVFVGVLICSVVLAALAMPLVAITAATATTTAMKAIVEPCVNSLWERREKKLEEEKAAMEMMRDSGLSLRELDGIQSVAEKLRNDYDALKKDAEFALRGDNDGNAIEVGIMEIKKKIELEGGIRSEIECLKNKVNAFVSEINRVRDEFVKFVRN
ncbi:hypothetical protein Cni_G20584 [Canna indica]|uniref:Uncharacterized protein n=1 Tax=Canna indica TaxID=4628 RepID=A0AAQ3QKW7_9LILI|nr:hypothetical protein Cni_G20584 [Canna indica]